MNNWSTFQKKKTDDLSFIFNFQNKKIYHIQKGEYSTYCVNYLLINFCNGKGDYSSLVLRD